jgi:hypothetical protein
MSTNNSKHIFFQLPKIIHTDPNTTNDHQILFMILYEQIRQHQCWNKSNKWLSIQAKIGISQLKIKLNDLEKWGYIIRKGRGLSRKFMLGRKMINRPESNPVQKQNRPESNPCEAGNQPLNRPESNPYNKNIYKNITKKEHFTFLTHEEIKELEYCVKGNFELGPEFKHLQPYLTVKRS